MAGLGTQEQDDKCDRRVGQAEKEMSEIAVKEKPIEQFRQELVDDIFKRVSEETTNSATFIKNGNYYSAKLAEAKIEGLYKALNIIFEASTVVVKEE